MKDQPISSLRGKWAKGIVPRNFTWILKDQFAVCERLGGHGSNHRSVRRREEIIWVLNSDFARVVSLIPANHNLHNYEELGLPFLHRPISAIDDFSLRLPEIYREIELRLQAGEQLLFHRAEVGDLVAGFVGGYVVWSGMVPHPPEAVTVAEQLLERQMGPLGRDMVGMTAKVAPKRKS